MNYQSEREVQEICKMYPKGTRVELVYMDDAWNTKVVPGCKGTVRCVDDMATIHVNWDCGSRLGVVHGVDVVKILEEE